MRTSSAPNTATTLIDRGRLAAIERLKRKPIEVVQEESSSINAEQYNFDLRSPTTDDSEFSILTEACDIWDELNTTGPILGRPAIS